MAPFSTQHLHTAPGTLRLGTAQMPARQLAPPTLPDLSLLRVRLWIDYTTARPSVNALFSTAGSHPTVRGRSTQIGSLPADWSPLLRPVIALRMPPWFPQPPPSTPAITATLANVYPLHLGCMSQNSLARISNLWITCQFTVDNWRCLWITCPRSYRRRSPFLPASYFFRRLPNF